MKRVVYVFATACLAYGVLEASLWAAVLVWLVFALAGFTDPPLRNLPVGLAIAVVVIAWAIALPRSAKAIRSAYARPIPESFSNQRYALALLSLAFAGISALAFASLRLGIFLSSIGTPGLHFYARLAAILLALSALPNRKPLFMRRGG